MPGALPAAGSSSHGYIRRTTYRHRHYGVLSVRDILLVTIRWASAKHPEYVIIVATTAGPHHCCPRHALFTQALVLDARCGGFLLLALR